jgi:phenylpyruvate tautomerase PptA (4-oxalocrotonate tautomerase family)
MPAEPPAGIPVLAEIVGQQLSADERRELIARITKLLATTLGERSPITVLAMSPSEAQAETG